MNDAELRTNGRSFTGWKSITVQMSMNQISGIFNFTAVDPRPLAYDKLNIKIGLPCKIYIGKTLVITGYIDDINASYDNENHTLQVIGRDVTGDLVDCSHIGLIGEAETVEMAVASEGQKTGKAWKNEAPLHIIKTLCNLFNISVEVDNSVLERANEKFEAPYVMEEGDTCFDAISEVCKHAAMLPVNYGDGKLTLTEGGTKRAYDSLELGVNIKAGALAQSNRDRYWLYIVKGTRTGMDDADLIDWTQPRGAASDDTILRRRILITLAKGNVDNKKCYRLAEWEKKTRVGKSIVYTYEVQGWTQSNGEIWPLNAKVRVKDPMFSLDEELLISEVEFSCDDSSGTITRLTIVPPETYSLEAKPMTKTGFDPVTDLSQPLPSGT